MPAPSECEGAVRSQHRGFPVNANVERAVTDAHHEHPRRVGRELYSITGRQPPAPASPHRRVLPLRTLPPRRDTGKVVAPDLEPLVSPQEVPGIPTVGGPEHASLGADERVPMPGKPWRRHEHLARRQQRVPNGRERVRAVVTPPHLTDARDDKNGSIIRHGEQANGP